MLAGGTPDPGQGDAPDEHDDQRSDGEQPEDLVAGAKLLRL